MPKDFTLKLTGLHYHVTLRLTVPRKEKKGKVSFFKQTPNRSLSRAEFMITMMQRCHSHGSLLWLPSKLVNVFFHRSDSDTFKTESHEPDDLMFTAQVTVVDLNFEML